MTRWTFGIVGAATMAICCGATAQEQATVQPPGDVAQQPPKDCTRYNGFYGFYGNVWCTPEEQSRWDKYDAERVRAAKDAESANRL